MSLAKETNCKTGVSRKRSASQRSLEWFNPVCGMGKRWAPHCLSLNTHLKYFVLAHIYNILCNRDTISCHLEHQVWKDKINPLSQHELPFSGCPKDWAYACHGMGGLTKNFLQQSYRELQVSKIVPGDDYHLREFPLIRCSPSANPSCSEEYFSDLRVGTIFFIPSLRKFTAHESAGSTVLRLKLLSTTLMNNAT